MLQRLALLSTLAGFIVSTSPAQPTTEPPDDVAYRILFTIMKSSPPPHWDLQTKVNWLSPAKFTLPEVYALQTVATKYWDRVDPLESELRAINDRFKGHNDSPEAVVATRPVRDKIAAEYQTALSALSKEMGSAGMEKLVQHIERMKKHMSKPGQQTLVGHSHPSKEPRR